MSEIWRNRWRAEMPGDVGPPGFRRPIATGEEYDGWKEFPSREAAEADAQEVVAHIRSQNGVYRAATWLGAVKADK